MICLQQSKELIWNYIWKALMFGITGKTEDIHD